MSHPLSPGLSGQLRQQLPFADLLLLAVLGDDTIATSTDPVLDHDDVFLAWSVLRKATWSEWAWRIPVDGIGTMAAFWTIERIAGF